MLAVMVGGIMVMSPFLLLPRTLTMNSTILFGVVAGLPLLWTGPPTPAFTSLRLACVDSPMKIRWTPRMKRFHPSLTIPVVGSMSST